MLKGGEPSHLRTPTENQFWYQLISIQALRKPSFKSVAVGGRTKSLPSILYYSILNLALHDTQVLPNNLKIFSSASNVHWGHLSYFIWT